jgi:hypothetical protein
VSVYHAPMRVVGAVEHQASRPVDHLIPIVEAELVRRIKDKMAAAIDLTLFTR